MGVNSYDDLKRHVGHNVVVVTYGKGKDIRNVACECEDCNEVLIDYDKDSNSYVTEQKLFLELLKKRIPEERMRELVEPLMSDERDDILDLYYNPEVD
jgi:hypothetical protein